jgi:hypothetical protein
VTISVSCHFLHWPIEIVAYTIHCCPAAAAAYSHVRRVAIPAPRRVRSPAGNAGAGAGHTAGVNRDALRPRSNGARPETCDTRTSSSSILVKACLPRRHQRRLSRDGASRPRSHTSASQAIRLRHAGHGAVFEQCARSFIICSHQCSPRMRVTGQSPWRTSPLDVCSTFGVSAFLIIRLSARPYSLQTK